MATQYIKTESGKILNALETSALIFENGNTFVEWGGGNRERVVYISKYDERDYIELSTEEMAKKYGVSVNAIMVARKRHKVFVRKKKIKITTPYQTLYVGSVSECAKELNLSIRSIRKALRGERVPILENLEIKLEVMSNVSKTTQKK